MCKMGRLTRKDYKKAPLHDLCGISTDCVVDCVDCFVIKLYDKLAHYEDLEEQGRLIELDYNHHTRDEYDRCTHRHCNNCDKYRRELQQYKDLEEQGRLIEQKHGTWEEADDGDGVVCSVCRTDFCTLIFETDSFKHCPNCGAKLKELEE